MKHCLDHISRAWLPVVATLLMSATSNAENVDIQGWIDQQVSDGKVLAASAARLVDGEVAYSAGGATATDGDADITAHTQFQIGSITKTFTNLLLAEMVADGKLRYDSTIGDIVGDDVEFGNTEVAGITLKRLATHTSGLPRLPVNLVPSDPLDPYRGYDEKALLAGLAASRDKQPLGDHYGYSNFGVGLLGYLLGRVDGRGYRTALQERVLSPLELNETGFVADNATAGFRAGVVVPDWTLDSLDGAGALWSSASDMMRLACIQLGDIDNPLKHKLADDFAVLETGPQGFRMTRVWHVAESAAGTIYWHNGGTGGFWSFFGFRPASREAVVMLVSGDPDPTPLGLTWLNREPFPGTAVAVDEALFGQYELAPGVGIGVYAMENTLVGQVSGQTPLTLERVTDDWYAIGEVDASVHFVRDDDAVVALELVQNGVVQSANRIADIAESQAREEKEMARELLAGYVGEYRINATATFTIRLGDAGLEAQITGQPFFPIYAKGDDVFFYKVVDAELHFERDDADAVDVLVLHQGDVVQPAEKAD